MSRKMIARLFDLAEREGARNMVIEGHKDKLAVAMHTGDGERSFRLPKELEHDLGAALRQLLKLAPDELASRRYCKVPGSKGEVAFYLSIQPSATGERIVINIIARPERQYSLSQLGLPRPILRRLQTALKARSGLILLSSPHGQGRSTTLRACLSATDRSHHSAYYLGYEKDPKLADLSLLTPTAKNKEKVLELDSEIIAFEISSPEDWTFALRAAQSGRLVIASLPGESAFSVLLEYLRLPLDLKTRLACLKLIVCQRLAALKRASRGRSQRTEIGLFECFVMSEAARAYLARPHKASEKKRFWEELGVIAIKDGFEPIARDKEKKQRLGLIS